MLDLNENNKKSSFTHMNIFFLFSCQFPWFHFVYFLFLSFQSIWLLSLCFPWLSSLSQYCLDTSSRLQLLSAVCVCVRVYCITLITITSGCECVICCLLMFQFLSEWWGSCTQMLQCVHNNVTRKNEVSIRMNETCGSKNPEKRCDQERQHVKTPQL